MRKWILLCTAALLLLSMMPVASAQGDPAMNAVNWLAAQQEENGSFDDDVEVTAFVAIALGALRQPNPAALAWLEEQVAQDNLSDLYDVGIVMTAVAASGGDVNSFADGALLELREDFIANLEFSDLNMMDACIGAVGDLNTGLPLADGVLEAILAAQMDNGAFATYSSESEVALPETTFCLQVLAASGESEAVEKGLAYLETIQNADGGWGLSYISEEGVSDGLATAIALLVLFAADEELDAWNNPENLLYSFQSPEGFFNTVTPEAAEAAEIPAEELASVNVGTTAFSALVFRGLPLTFLAAEAESSSTSSASSEIPEGPALDSTWGSAVAGGFGMAELDSADDFFVTVVDPFTDEELYGVEILNWVAEYQYTGFIITDYLPADVLLWMAEQDPSLWENLSPALLEKLAPEVLEALPADVQAMVE